MLGILSLRVSHESLRFYYVPHEGKSSLVDQYKPCIRTHLAGDVAGDGPVEDANSQNKYRQATVALGILSAVLTTACLLVGIYFAWKRMRQSDDAGKVCTATSCTSIKPYTLCNVKRRSVPA